VTTIAAGDKRKRGSEMAAVSSARSGSIRRNGGMAPRSKRWRSAWHGATLAA